MHFMKESCIPFPNADGLLSGQLHIWHREMSVTFCDFLDSVSSVFDSVERKLFYTCFKR